MKTIGIFDSGMGGVTLVSDLHQKAPELNIIYLGDSLHAPYGEKDTEEIKELSLACTKSLIEKGAEAIVIACNTATSAAAIMLRETFDMPIIGMEPALKPAVEHSEGGTVVVLATSYTLYNDKFLNLQKRVAEGAKVKIIAAPGLVEYVEGGMKDKKALFKYFDELFQGVTSTESIVLGCTHFVYLKEELSEYFGKEMRFFDGNEGTVNHLLRKVREDGLNSRRGDITFLNTMGEEMIDRTKSMLSLYESRKQESLDWNLVQEKLSDLFSGDDLLIMKLYYKLDPDLSIKGLAKELGMTQKAIKEKMKQGEKKLYKELKTEEVNKLFVKTL